MNTEITQDTCSVCAHTSDYHEFVWDKTGTKSICQNAEACARRVKRNKVIAEMRVMAQKPYVHPVDKFSRTAVAVCGFFFGCIITIGLGYLWFGI